MKPALVALSLFFLPSFFLHFHVLARENIYQMDDKNVAAANSEYMETVQKATFGFCWNFAHTTGGTVLARTGTPNMIATVGRGFGESLFFTHRPCSSMNPRLMKERKTNFWKQNVNHTLVNQSHCVQETNKSFGYSVASRGLTAGDDFNFYEFHSPTNYNCTILSAAALSSFSQTPFPSLSAFRYLHFEKGNPLFDKYGFVNAYNASLNWYANQFLAIDQGTIVLILENYRAGSVLKIGESVGEYWVRPNKMRIVKPEYKTGFYLYVPIAFSNEYLSIKQPSGSEYVLDFAMGAEGNDTIDLSDKNGVLINRKTFIVGNHQHEFESKQCKYEAIVSEDVRVNKTKLNLK
ncbi:MAG: glucoamylase family protein [Cytophagales bacterium]